MCNPVFANFYAIVCTFSLLCLPDLYVCLRIVSSTNQVFIAVLLYVSSCVLDREKKIEMTKGVALAE